MHDKIVPDGRFVQVKVAQVKKVAISECPDYLIVLHINRDGGFEEVYNGSGKPAWEAAGKMQKTGQRHVSLSKLRRLLEAVEPEDRTVPVSGSLI